MTVNLTGMGTTIGVVLDFANTVIPRTVDSTTTVEQMVQSLKDEFGMHFKGNGYQVRETQTGRVLAPSEVLMPDRLYYLSAWPEPKKTP